MTTFEQLNLSAPLLKAVLAEGYETPTPIQTQAIPYLLQGRDLLGIAQTGTGKTAAFALPMLERLMKDGAKAQGGTCRALILSPTRELCAQILESFKTYGRNTKLKSAVVFGGVGINRQIETMKAGVDILVATPGRLVDLIDRRALSLSKVEIFVLDEVDQMLDLGFIHAIRKLTAMLPKARQNLFFSATMPKEIAGLAAALLKDPARVEITPVATTAERVTQVVIHMDPAAKPKILVDLLKNPQITRALIFTRTKHGADKVVKVLHGADLESAAIHGNKSQANRERALAGFKAGKVLALVATDIAARGIDVDGVSHVFNYDLPYVPESYVHRIGRTARAGAAGEAIAFCTPEDRGLLRDIEKTIRQQIPIQDHEMGLKVDQLVPNFGWNPADAKRKSGGGRHMPNAAKKTYNRNAGPAPTEANAGRFAKGDTPRVEAPKVVAVVAPTQPVKVARPASVSKKPWTPMKSDDGSVARDYAPRPDKVEAERPRSDRPTGDRFGNNRPRGDKPFGEKKFGERKFGDKPRGDRPMGDRPRTDRPAGDRPVFERPASDRPRGERPTGDRPQFDRPASERPAGAHPQGERKFGERKFGGGGKTGFGKPKSPGARSGKPSWAGKPAGRGKA